MRHQQTKGLVTDIAARPVKTRLDRDVNDVIHVVKFVAHGEESCSIALDGFAGYAGSFGNILSWFTGKDQGLQPTSQSSGAVPMDAKRRGDLGVSAVVSISFGRICT